MAGTDRPLPGYVRRSHPNSRKRLKLPLRRTLPIGNSSLGREYLANSASKQHRSISLISLISLISQVRGRASPSANW